MKKIILSIALALFSAGAIAWPTSPITLVVPYGPGGISDRLARIYQVELESRTKQPVTVVYKPGGTNAVAANYVMSIGNDNHTFLVTDTDFIAGSLNNNLNFHKQFTGVSVAFKWAYVVFGNDNASVTKLQKQIQKEKEINVANLGVNGGTHRWTKQLKSNLYINSVAYKATPAIITDVVGGHIEYGIFSVINFSQNSSLKLTPVMVSSETRNPSLKSVPTYKELGFVGSPGYGWHGVLARKDTDPSAIKKMSELITNINQSNETLKQFTNQGIDMINLSYTESVVFLDREIAKYNENRTND